MSPKPLVSSTFFIAMISVCRAHIRVSSAIAHVTARVRSSTMKVCVRHGHRQCDQRKHLCTPNPNVFSCVFHHVHRMGQCVEARCLARLGCTMLLGNPCLTSFWLCSLRCWRGHHRCPSLHCSAVRTTCAPVSSAERCRWNHLPTCKKICQCVEAPGEWPPRHAPQFSQKLAVNTMAARASRFPRCLL